MSENELPDKVVTQLIHGPATLTELATTLDRHEAPLLVALKELQRSGFAQIRDSKWSLTECKLPSSACESSDCTKCLSRLWSAVGLPHGYKRTAMEGDCATSASGTRSREDVETLS